MYSYGETGETMYFLWGDNVFLWERQFIFKYKPDFGLIGWVGGPIHGCVVFLNLEKEYCTILYTILMSAQLGRNRVYI